MHPGRSWPYYPNVPTRAILSEAQSARIVDALRRRVRVRHNGNVTELARELGLPQPRLSRTLNGAHGASLATATALARVEGVSVESILSSPRERAAELAREAGVSDRAIARVLAEPEREEPRPVLFYVDRMRAYAVLDDDGASRGAG